MKSNRLDSLNIALMLLAVGVAIVLPFRLFLFSYAILGPLHYLTEIGWLRERNYFAKGKATPWILTILAILASLGYLAIHPEIMNWHGFKILSSRLPHIILMAFVCSLIVTMVENWRRQVLYSMVAVVLIFSFYDLPAWVVFLCVMLPTLLHVYVFTGLFILLGSLKSGSWVGWLSLLIFIGSAVLFFVVPETLFQGELNDGIRNIIEESGFASLNRDIGAMLGDTGSFDLASPMAQRVQALIAFAYTYHYLNWFSKTGIIKWHKVPRSSLVFSAVIWVVSVGLYIWDFQTGLMALFFLSLMHVFLEFPLNHQSFGEIGRRLVGRE